MSRRAAFHLGTVATAIMLAVVPFDSWTVERWFSTGIYPHVQRRLTPISNLAPFAIFDLLVLAAAGFVLTLLVRGAMRARVRRSWWPMAGAARQVLTLAALVYIAFLALWGLNYRRVPMRERLVVAEGAPGADAVWMLGWRAVQQVNELHAGAHGVGWRGEESHDEGLRRSFARVQGLLSDAPPGVPGRLKRSLFGPYFRWTSVDGMVDPFALEVLANPDLLPWERPFVAAHEWAHLAGYADEADANFVGFLTAVGAGVSAQYSAWLFLYWEVSGDMGAADRARLSTALAAGPRRDVNAIIDRLRRGQLPMLRRASWAVYDQYLRANRVEEGIRSYGQVVTLILRARFEDEWRPVRRSAASSR